MTHLHKQKKKTSSKKAGLIHVLYSKQNFSLPVIYIKSKLDIHETAVFIVIQMLKNLDNKWPITWTL